MQENDIEIARKAKPLPIREVARKLGLSAECLYPYGTDKAKVSLEVLRGSSSDVQGCLILVTAMTPTIQGEGKTTTSVGLADGLARCGKKTLVCLREPSLGPCFGRKGGAAGGGYAQVVPMEDINLHFTGDLHAINAAHNLLAAMLDNHIYWGNELQIQQMFLRRTIDMNDRSLRTITYDVGERGNGTPHQSGFDIVAASEVMSIFCLARDLLDLREKMGRIVVAVDKNERFVSSRDLQVAGAMTALLKDALAPNLVQTLEHTPAFIHGGPFANIAHGCSSLISTRMALKLAEYVVTEAGFGADLGAEKFFSIKCRKGGLTPSLAVVVATIRALKVHGNVPKNEMSRENPAAVEKGTANLLRHLENLRLFHVPVVVALNTFETDKESEKQALEAVMRNCDVRVVRCRHWSDGSKGSIDLAREVIRIARQRKTTLRQIYPDTMSLEEKIRTIAQKIYRAQEVTFSDQARRSLELYQRSYGHFPVCIAKTPYSFTAYPERKGAPCNHSFPIQSLRLCAGAEFVVALAGNMMTMPGLPRKPAAQKIFTDSNNRIHGLF